MKYCYQCGRMTAGEPLFCQSCGRSFDVKLCHRLHVNPRHAEVCSQCGSRELSTPQPKVPVAWKLLGYLVRLTTGTFLVLFSLFVVAELLQSSAVQNGLIALGLLVLAFWAAWTMVPDWLQTLMHRAIKRRQRRYER